MNLKTLRDEYGKVKHSSDATEIVRFAKMLTASNDLDVIEYHYMLLRDQKNQKLYHHIRRQFLKRGESASQFLLQRIHVENDPMLKGDILHILGRMRNPEALPIARQAIDDLDPSIRSRSCYVLGWMGEAQDVSLLGERLTTDSESSVRITAATSHDQLRMNHPELKDRLLCNLNEALGNEADNDVAGWIIVTVQYFLSKQFGMHENIQEATLAGSVEEARPKCLRALQTSTLP